MIDQEMKDLVTKVRNTYFLECHHFRVRTRGEDRGGWRPNDRVIASWDGGKDPRGVVHSKPVWNTIIKFAFLNQVDPVMLVRASFHDHVGNSPPMPNMIPNGRNLERARQFASEAKEHYHHLLVALGDESRREMMIKRHARPFASDGELWREIITSPVVSGGPLFRFTLATNVGQLDLADAYRREAALEYIENPEAYDEVLGQHLPASFREEARRLRHRFVQGV